MSTPSSRSSRRPAVRLRLTPRRRHLAAIVTIALSTAFVAVMVLAGNLLQGSLAAGIDDDLRGADLVVTGPEPASSPLPPEPVARPDVPGATAVWPRIDAYAQVRAPGLAAPAFVRLTMDPPPVVAPTPLQEGREAEAGDEVVTDPDAASALAVGIGDTIMVPAASSPTGTEQSLRVVGIARATQSSAIGAGIPRLHLTDANAASVLGPDALRTAPAWYAALPSGTDPAAALPGLRAQGLSARTAGADRETQLAELLQGMAPLALIVSVFVLIALVTSAVVIANTFAVTLAQRVRSLALLHTLGARRGQVARVVLRESLGVGVLGSVIGVALGHLLVQGALAAAVPLGWLHGVLAVPMSPLSVALPLLAGVLVTLAAGIGPVRTATRVAPLAALRPQPQTAPRRPGWRGALGTRGMVGLIGLVGGLAVLGGGMALSLSGSTAPGILLAMAGGVVSFTGVLLGLVAVTGPLARAAGAVLGRIGGLPARIAATACTRSPRRSAATISALLIGTTLMTMMAVGSATAESSLTRDLASRKPFDIQVSADAMPADAADRIRAVPGMGAAESVAMGDVEVGGPEPMTLHGVTPEQLARVASREDLGDALADDTVVLGIERADRFGVHDGQELELRGADGAPHRLRVRIDGNLQMSLVTPRTLSDLVGDATRPEVLARFAPQGSAAREGVDGAAIATSVQDLAAGPGWEGAQVSVEGMEREMYGRILAVLLGITLALLAVAVVVALVGVANTLSLGVIERTGENALLRALGTTRGQIRAMLGWEGVLLALIGAVLGVALGTLYGVLGILTLLGGAFPVVVTIPWLRIATVLVLAVLAGWAASVLPGRRAARTAPARALAALE